MFLHVNKKIPAALSGWIRPQFGLVCGWDQIREGHAAGCMIYACQGAELHGDASIGYVLWWLMVRWFGPSDWWQSLIVSGGWKELILGIANFLKANTTNTQTHNGACPRHIVSFSPSPPTPRLSHLLEHTAGLWWGSGFIWILVHRWRVGSRYKHIAMY